MPSVPGVVNFPTLLDDAVSLIQYNNNASSPLSSGINNSVLLIPVTSPSEFSNSGVVTIVDSLVNPTIIEIVLYTSKSGSDLVVPPGGRGAQGTAASAFNAGAVVEQRATARGFTVLADAIIAMQNTGTNGTYTNTASGNAVANTTTETSMFTGATASAGASRTIAANSAKAGSAYRLRIEGTLATTGTPTIQFRVKLGSTVVADSTAFATPNNSAGMFFIDVVLHISAIGASGSSRAHIEGNVTPGITGVQTPTHFRGLNSAVTVDTTVDQTIEITAQWGTANAANTTAMTRTTIERIR